MLPPRESWLSSATISGRNASAEGVLSLIGNDFGEKCFRRGSPDPQRQRFRGEMLLSLCCWGRLGGNFSKSGGKVSGSMVTSTSSVTANSLTADSLEKPCARMGHPYARSGVVVVFCARTGLSHARGATDEGLVGDRGNRRGRNWREDRMNQIIGETPPRLHAKRYCQLRRRPLCC